MNELHSEQPDTNKPYFVTTRSVFEPVHLTSAIMSSDKSKIKHGEISFHPSGKDCTRWFKCYS